MGTNLILLGLFARAAERVRKIFHPPVVFGRVRLFFYVIHLFLYAVLGLPLTPHLEGACPPGKRCQARTLHGSRVSSSMRRAGVQPLGAIATDIARTSKTWYDGTMGLDWALTACPRPRDREHRWEG
jgi:hypothetical protein